MTHSYVSVKLDDRHQMNQSEECVKDSGHGMLSNILLLSCPKRQKYLPEGGVVGHRMC